MGCGSGSVSGLVLREAKPKPHPRSSARHQPSGTLQKISTHDESSGNSRAGANDPRCGSPSSKGRRHPGLKNQKQVQTTYIPAVLYRINTETGAATKIVNLVGSSTVMGLAFAPNGKLYATDFTANPGLYVVDPKTGFESAVAALSFGPSSGLELADPLP